MSWKTAILVNGVSSYKVQTTAPFCIDATKEMRIISAALGRLGPTMFEAHY